MAAIASIEISDRALVFYAGIAASSSKLFTITDLPYVSSSLLDSEMSVLDSDDYCMRRIPSTVESWRSHQISSLNSVPSFKALSLLVRAAFSQADALEDTVRYLSLLTSCAVNI